MADVRKRITDLPVESNLDDTDLLLIGANGTAALRRTTFGAFKEWVKEGETSFLDKIYPVGSMYFSVNPTNPSALFGGLWSPVTGAYLYLSHAVAEVGTKIGSNVLKPDNLPAHKHSIAAHAHEIDISASTVVIKNGGSHVHSGKGDKDAATGTGKFRYNKDGSTTYADFIPKSGAHTHEVEPHYHTVSCKSTASDPKNLSTGITGDDSPAEFKPVGFAVYAWRRVS